MSERPVILVPGTMHEHALARMEKRFAVMRTALGDPDLVDAGMAAKIRGVATFLTPVGPDLIDALPALEIIGNLGVGYDCVDAGHAARRGVMVTNTPDVLTDEVADTTIGLLLSTVRELHRAETWLRQGNWVREGNYRFTPGTMRGRKVGIYGLGRIGLAIARRIEGFGLPVSYHSRRPVEGVPYAYHATLLDLAGQVDTLISVVPATAQTEKSVDSAVLAALGPEGVFINVGRGSVVDEAALVEALRNGAIMAAGLDVYANEPHVPQALLDLPNATLLPHVGSASVHTRRAMADLLVDNLEAWFDGRNLLTPVPESAASAG